MNKNGWQLAIVDWDFLKKINPLLYSSLSDEIAKFNALPKSSPSGLKSGTVCYIIDLFYADPSNKVFKLASSPLYGQRAPLFNLWVPSLQRYMYCIMQAVHPIVTEQDAIDAELRFPESGIRRWM